MRVYAARAAQAGLFVCAHVCLFARPRARAGHNGLQMILSVCQRPRIAALVCSAATGLGKYFSNCVFTFTLAPHSWPSLSKIISFFFRLFTPAGLES